MSAYGRRAPEGILPAQAGNCSTKSRGNGISPAKTGKYKMPTNIVNVRIAGCQNPGSLLSITQRSLPKNVRTPFLVVKWKRVE